MNAAKETLQMSYRELEKKICSLKFENANLQEAVEALQDELAASQKNQGWGGILADTVAAMEAVGVPASIVMPPVSSTGPFMDDAISLDMSMAGSTR